MKKKMITIMINHRSPNGELFPAKQHPQPYPTNVF